MAARAGLIKGAGARRRDRADAEGAATRSADRALGTRRRRAAQRSAMAAAAGVNSCCAAKSQNAARVRAPPYRAPSRETGDPSFCDPSHPETQTLSDLWNDALARYRSSLDVADASVKTVTYFQVLERLIASRDIFDKL
ncbi:hypothetical protein PENSPDRAFT_671623 [Peniophora sp. CONT]|nr:hypothetical protein PENSPDRAFT_671623 [Peniophora sp. CONT]